MSGLVAAVSNRGSYALNESFNLCSFNFKKTKKKKKESGWVTTRHIFFFFLIRMFLGHVEIKIL